MVARALARIWFLLPPMLDVITLTSFVSLASANPIERVYIDEPVHVTHRSRFYRQADFEEITDTEPIEVKENNNPYETNSETEKYDTLLTTDVINSNKTVIPLTLTDSYESSASENYRRDETETVTRSMTTENNDYVELSEVTKYNTTTETSDLIKDNKNYVDTTPNINLNRNLEDVTSPDSEKHTTINKANELPVVGISNTISSELTDISKVETHAERIMILQPLQNEKYVWLKETVHNMVQETMLKKETEDYVSLLHRRYEDLPVVDADNSIWRKYSRAVVENFVLDFCRNYLYYNASEESIARWYKEEEYNRIYNTTLLRLQLKKSHTAIQFAAPVRRAADIYKAILDTPIGIVQSKCKVDMPRWLCFAEYIVHLADMSETCEHVWYHAQVHLTVLRSIRNAKGAKDPANEIIDELNLRLLKMDSDNDVNYLFDFIIQTLGDLSARLKDSLLSQVSLHNLIRDLQSEDNLKCLSIDIQEL